MFHWLSSKNGKTQKQQKPYIFFHEDFYRQVEFVPEENYFERNAHINKLPKKQTSENGFMECIARDNHPFLTANRNIPLDDIDSLLSPLAKTYFNEVKTGYGQTMYDAEYTYVWGFERYGIFIETNFQRKIVHNIFIAFNHHFDNQKDDATNFTQALISLGRQYKLLLVDWNINSVIKTSTAGETIRYILNNYNFHIDEDSIK